MDFIFDKVENPLNQHLLTLNIAQNNCYWCNDEILLQGWVTTLTFSVRGAHTHLKTMTDVCFQVSGNCNGGNMNSKRL